MLSISPHKHPKRLAEHSLQGAIIVAAKGPCQGQLAVSPVGVQNWGLKWVWTAALSPLTSQYAFWFYLHPSGHLLRSSNECEKLKACETQGIVKMNYLWLGIRVCTDPCAESSVVREWLPPPPSPLFTAPTSVNLQLGARGTRNNMLTRTQLQSFGGKGRFECRCACYSLALFH